MSLYFTVQENPACYAAEQTRAGLKPENMQHPVDSSLSNVFNNGGSPLGTSMHAMVDMSAHSNRINGPPSMFSAQNSNMGLIQGINGGMIKSEPTYSGCSPYMFGTDGNILEARPTVGDASVTSFTNVESNSHSVNESVLDPDTSPFGFLGQIPRNFSLSDLTADFSQSSGMSSLLCLCGSMCVSACILTTVVGDSALFLMVMNKMLFRLFFMLVVFLPIF